MALSTTDPSTPPSRSRRRVTRINYAEDVSIDDIVPPSGSPAKPLLDAKSTNGSSSALASTTNTTKVLFTPSSPSSSPSSSSTPPPSLSTSQQGVFSLAQNSSSKVSASTKSVKSIANSLSTSLKREASENDIIPMNWQPPQETSDVFGNMIDLKDSYVGDDSSLHLSDGTVYSPEDHIYLVSEPPGEPYYIARLMEFVYSPIDDHNKAAEDFHSSQNPSSESASKSLDSQRKRKCTAKALQNLQEKQQRRRQKPKQKPHVDISLHENYMVRVNWLYRPKDISKRSSDSRVLYITMNSELCPLASIRGKCVVTHREHIKDFDSFRSSPDHFWFDKFYDRYIIRFFDVVPTEKIINIPEKAQKVLRERFKHAIVEVGRAKELCASPKNCEKCTQWCSPDDSIQCANCRKYYHMLCVDPPLEKKPSRGFGWSCAVCANDRERRIQELSGLTLEYNKGTQQNNSTHSDASETPPIQTSIIDVSSNSNSNTTTNDGSTSPPPMTRFEQLKEAFNDDSAHQKITEEQRHNLRLWPFRYLGVHAKIEDVLDMDDRIYPRAASRLGQRHQAPVSDWPGKPVVYYDIFSSDKKQRKSKSSSKKQAAANESKVTPVGSRAKKELEVLPEGITSLEDFVKPKNRPMWLQPKPIGYQERGDDETSQLMWERPKNEASQEEADRHDKQVEDFLERAKPIVQKLNIPAYTPNFMDACLKAFLDSNRDPDAAFKVIEKLTRKSLKEPTLTEAEKNRFAEGVKLYGSELHEVYTHVKTASSADVVRYYYLWKKTPEGHKIWDNYEGRKRNKVKALEKKEGGLVDDVADNADDSAYDNEKSERLKRSYTCKHCQTTTSLAWRRAPGQPIANVKNPIVALCIRCARLWRRYAVVWEEPLEVMRRISYRSGNSWKRKIEMELYEDAKAILDERERNPGLKPKKQKSITSTNGLENAVYSTSVVSVSGSITPLDSGATSASSTLEATANNTKSTLTKTRKNSDTLQKEKEYKPRTHLKNGVSSYTSNTAKSKSSRTRRHKQKDTSPPSEGDIDSLSTLSSPPSSGSSLSSITGNNNEASQVHSEKGSRLHKAAAAKSFEEFESNGSTTIILADENTFSNEKSSNKQHKISIKLEKNHRVSKKGSSSQRNLARRQNKNKAGDEAKKKKSTKQSQSYEENKLYKEDTEMSNSGDLIKTKSESADLDSDTKINNRQPGESLAPDVANSVILRPCSVCNQTDNLLHISCNNCGMAVHHVCYGLPVDKSLPSSWLCDACENELNPRLSTFYSCMLCPVRDLASQQENVAPSTATIMAEKGTSSPEIKQEFKPFTCPDALKPTYDNLWAHVKCAVWVPELTFGTSSLKPVNNINTIGPRFNQVCFICKTSNGACIECDHCNIPVHVGCADSKSYFRGMELVSVSELKASKELDRKMPGEVFCMFNSNEVRLRPVVLCNAAQLAPRHYDLGHVCSVTKKPILQVYIENQKIEPVSTTGAIARANLYKSPHLNENESHSNHGNISGNEAIEGNRPVSFASIDSGYDDLMHNINIKLSGSTKDLMALNEKFGIKNLPLEDCTIPSHFNLIRNLPPPSFHKQTSSAIQSLIEMDKQAEIETSKPVQSSYQQEPMSVHNLQTHVQSGRFEYDTQRKFILGDYGCGPRQGEYSYNPSYSKEYHGANPGSAPYNDPNKPVHRRTLSSSSRYLPHFRTDAFSGPTKDHYENASRSESIIGHEQRDLSHDSLSNVGKYAPLLPPLSSSYKLSEVQENQPKIQGRGSFDYEMSNTQYQRQRHMPAYYTNDIASQYHPACDNTQLPQPQNTRHNSISSKHELYSSETLGRNTENDPFGNSRENQFPLFTGQRNSQTDGTHEYYGNNKDNGYPQIINTRQQEYHVSANDNEARSFENVFPKPGNPYQSSTKSNTNESSSDTNHEFKNSRNDLKFLASVAFSEISPQKILKQATDRPILPPLNFTSRSTFPSLPNIGNKNTGNVPSSLSSSIIGNSSISRLNPGVNLAADNQTSNFPLAAISSSPLLSNTNKSPNLPFLIPSHSSNSSTYSESAAFQPFKNNEGTAPSDDTKSTSAIPATKSKNLRLRDLLT